MDEQAVALEARLMALEYMVAHLYVAMYRTRGTDPSVIEELHGGVRRIFREQTFPNLNPVKSDFVSAELESALERILLLIEEMMGMDRKPAR